MIYDEAAFENVRPEILYAQIMLETGYLQYGGDVEINQFNFGGLGATGNGVKGNSFVDVRTGIKAQVQHFKGVCICRAFECNASSRMKDLNM